MSHDAQGRALLWLTLAVILQTIALTIHLAGHLLW